jgi:thymidine phosphorylase
MIAPEGLAPQLPYQLKARRSGIDTGDEPVVFMHVDCAVCQSEGLRAHTRVLVSLNQHQIVATARHVLGDMVKMDEVALSEAAWLRLSPEPGELLSLAHPPALPSLSAVRGKIYGQRLSGTDIDVIIADIVAGRYSDIHSAAFLSACAAHPLDLTETAALTRAMVATGDQLTWDYPVIADKHCVGGLPGNRTTPIVVAIVASLGLPIPKTSSRAITSPAGTADVMATLAPVDLSLDQIHKVVEQEAGCIVWGGSVRMSPADDQLIRIERALDIDGAGQMVASVLSKKIAAGATHLVLDVPVGPTAKIRSHAGACSIIELVEAVAPQFGLAVRAMITDGTQPVGSGIGPALEARDVLAVLQNAPGAPEDLHNRAVVLAGALLEFSGTVGEGQGVATAAAALTDGRAWGKFQRICEAQGGMRTPTVASQSRDILAPIGGQVLSIDNRKLAKVAKLAGAPEAPAAGVTLVARIGDRVVTGQPLFLVHAENISGLEYSLANMSPVDEIITIGEGP